MIGKCKQQEIGHFKPYILLVNAVYTLPGQKCWNTTKYSCTDCTIYRLNIQLGPKMGIETCRYQKFVVLALTWVNFFKFFDIPWGVNLLIT